VVALELDESLAGKPELTLAGVFDRTATAMGGRMLRRWLHRPLRDPRTLRTRYHAVATLLEAAQHTAVAEPLKAIGDLERIAARIALRSARPRDFAQLRAALAVLPHLHAILANTPSPLLQELIAEFGSHDNDIRGDHALLMRAIGDSPPHHLRDGGVIAPGYDAELDELRLLGSNTEQFLLGQMYDQALTAQGYSIHLDPNIGPTTVTYGALLKGTLAKNKPKVTFPPAGGPIGLPADFLIATDATIVAAHYGKHADDQWSVDEMLALVRRVAAA